MRPPAEPDQPDEPTPDAPARRLIAEPDFSGDPQPIEQFAVRTDFPQCALGAHIDIRGFAGVVVEIVNQSIRVSSSEGVTQRFNSHRLRALCAPPDRAGPVPATRNTDHPKPAAKPGPPPPRPGTPPRVHIADPDFSAPARRINDYAVRPDFPQCAYGKHVDIVGYTGVVVEIVKGSLRIQSPAGIMRSYTGGVLKKLYGRT